MLAITLWSATALAWRERGHRLVARLVETQLSQAARDQVALLLAADGTASLADTAEWADLVRETAAYSGTWRLHFVNPERPSCNYVATRDCPDGNCIVAAIERFSAELGDRARPATERAIALKFLVHLVADVHQPFHAGFADDHGGNDFQLNVNGQGSNLHAVWDHVLLAHSGLDENAHLQRLGRGRPPHPGSADPADWARASCRLIHDRGLYPLKHRIGDPYLDRFLPLAERRLRLAAVRLARLLEDKL